MFFLSISLNKISFFVVKKIKIEKSHLFFVSYKYRVDFVFIFSSNYCRLWQIKEKKVSSLNTEIRIYNF